MFFAAMLLVLCGCGSDGYYRVTGTVTLEDEKPVANATLQFHPLDESGSVASAVTNESGKFILSAAEANRGEAGAKPGEYKITIEKWESVRAGMDANTIAYNEGKITYEQYAAGLAQGSMANRRTQKPKNVLLKIYASTDSTPLRFVVEPKNRNVCDLKLSQ